MKLANLPLAAPLFALCLLATASSPQAATENTKPATEPGVLLRHGVWDGDVGSYLIPQAFEQISPAKWPKTGWYRLVLGNSSIHSEAVTLDKHKNPAFLQAIIRQIPAQNNSSSGSAASSAPISTPTPTPVSSSEEAERYNEFFLRVPGTTLQTGTLPVYRFKNGSPRLLPELDYRYQLKLGAQDFAFSVRNGQRGKNGVPYGSGAHYRIEYDGQQYDYELPGFGWDSAIRAIADLDGDGKPDFIIYVGGSNSTLEVILLSSKAKPGKNVPTASLASQGC